MPRLPAVRCAEQCGVFHSGINSIRVIEGRFEMPDALELPGTLCPIVPLVRARHALVDKHVALPLWHTVRTHQILRLRSRRLPRFAAIIGALDDLPEPRARLRCVNAVRLNRRTFHMINLPARKMRAADLPAFARAIRCQDERAFPCANQYS